MKSIEEVLPLLRCIIEGLGKHFGKNCELVVHDYSQDFSSSITAIENGHITGRKVGSSGSKIGLRVMQGVETEDGQYNYTTRTKNGRVLKSSTIYLKNDDGEVIGSLCINCDVTDLLGLQGLLNDMIPLAQQETAGTDDVIYDDVESILEGMINQSIEYIGTPVALMTREQKIEGINYLYRRGAFKIKNAATAVAKYYDISRYTVYNYINEADER